MFYLYVFVIGVHNDAAVTLTLCLVFESEKVVINHVCLTGPSLRSLYFMNW